MELIFILPFMLLVGWMFGKQLNNNDTDKNKITRVGDKAWIIGNEFVNLEEDTPLNTFKQEQEDRKHYQAFERERLMHDRLRIGNEWMKTKQAIGKYPDLKDCVTTEKLKAITNKYKKYLNMCNKLDETMVLNKEEFLIKEENPAFCVDFSGMMFLQTPVGCYNIYNTKKAKYHKGDIQKMIADEFKEKWY